MGHSILRSGGRWALALGLGVVLLFSACGGADAKNDGAEANGAEADGAEAAAAGNKGGTPVAITNFLFEPAELQVPPGTKVTWTNNDDAPHNVQDISDLNTPISKELNKGESFSITYEQPGEYKYDCGLHTYMTGTIKVM
ncbi:MAG: plastocyanin/azurin family copper-binding protein [Acidimicrobiia bacterium]